jgi:hypothetical protein
MSEDKYMDIAMAMDNLRYDADHMQHLITAYRSAVTHENRCLIINAISNCADAIVKHDSELKKAMDIK